MEASLKPERSSIYNGESTLITFVGTPYSKLVWRLYGTGSLTNADNYADSRGVAKAVLVPSADSQICRVEVDYVS